LENLGLWASVNQIVMQENVRSARLRGQLRRCLWQRCRGGIKVQVIASFPKPAGTPLFIPRSSPRQQLGCTAVSRFLFFEGGAIDLKANGFTLLE
jgi:hypothetical protein